MAQVMYRVYVQLTPEPTGQHFTATDPRTKERKTLEWYRSRLLEIGYVRNMREAKKLTSHPILEEVTESVH